MSRWLLPFRRSRVAALAAATLVTALVVWAPIARATTPLYPDLVTLPPESFQFDRVEIDGEPQEVMRFTTVTLNRGPGPLELRGQSAGTRTYVFQRIHDDTSSLVEEPAGEFVYHPTHRHWHFEQFADHELWPRAEFDAWIASGRQEGQPRWRGSKTTGEGESVCVQDSMRVGGVPGTPDKKGYSGCRRDIQGLSVGWGDRYAYDLPGQWVAFGAERPPDGEYVLRIVADPNNHIFESEGKADPARESQEANEHVLVLEFNQQRAQAIQLQNDLWLALLRFLLPTSRYGVSG
jgi:hypothetical protein